MKRSDLPLQRFIAHPGGPSVTSIQRTGDVVAAVGPEGGFTDEEVVQAEAAGWQRVGLGGRILRVETAAIVLSAILSI